MNEPLDPVSARQARQGKPVLVILAISLILALIGGWILWGIMANDGPAAPATDTSQSLDPVAPAPAS